MAELSDLENKTSITFSGLIAVLSCMIMALRR